MVKRIRVLILFLLSGIAAFGQTRVQLISSESLTGYGIGGLQHIIRPVFSHQGSTLSADSANYNPGLNIFDAFGNVVITQPGGMRIYSDLLNYNGNNNVALLTNNVRMVDQDATLTTNYLTYNTATKIGTYTNGGKIVNGENVVTSKNGYYFANSRDAYFRYNAVVKSPDALIKSDTLRYNTGSKIAYFYGPTNIYGKDDTLYTENGNYNTLNDQARFGKKNLYTQGSKSLTGDSLFYDRKVGFGRAINRITFIDTAQKIILKGDLGLYRKSDESIKVTKNAYVVMISEADSGKVDSIWVTADTLFSKVVDRNTIKIIQRSEVKKDSEVADTRDETQGKAALDSAGAVAPPELELKKVTVDPDSVSGLKSGTLTKMVLVPTDSLSLNSKGDTLKRGIDSTAIGKKALDKKGLKGSKSTLDSAASDTAKTRIILAFHQVKVFKSDLQARADSMFFSYADSTMRCYYDPMIWAQGSQLSADTVYLQLKNRKLDNMLLKHDGFIVNTEGDSSRFNQVKGKTLTGFFKDSKLDRMFVDGNAESIYFAKEDSSYSGMNKSVSSRMKVLFADNKLSDIIFIRKPEMVYYPIDKLPQDTVLKGFIWKPKDRPKSKEEIIPTLKQAKKPAAIVPKKQPVTVPKKQPVSAPPKRPVKSATVN